MIKKALILASLAVLLFTFQPPVHASQTTKPNFQSSVILDLDKDFIDQFDRPDADKLNPSNTLPWEHISGNIGIKNQEAVILAGSCPKYAVVDVKTSNGTLIVKMGQVAQDQRILFGFQDINNFYYLEVDGNKHYLLGKYSNGQRKGLGFNNLIRANSGDELTIKYRNSKLIVSLNSTNLFNINDKTTPTNGSKIGIGSFCGLGGTFKSIRFTPESATSPTTKPIFSNPEIFQSTKTVNIFAIIFVPDENNDGRIDNSANYGNASGSFIDTSDGLLANINDTLDQGIWALTEASKYHGYKNPTATPAINFKILGKKIYRSPIPIGLQLDSGNPKTYRPDYQKILKEINICDLVDNQGLQQVWMWSPHGNIIPVESNTSMGTNSKYYWNFWDYGDVSNSERTNDLPICQKSYFLYNYNVNRGLGELLEDHLHHFENLFLWLDEDTFWEKFTGSKKYDSQLYPTNGTYRCGWAHYSPNSKTDYSWTDQTKVISDCEDWQIDTIGKTKLVDCKTWPPYTCPDDSGASYKIWLLQNYPGFGNTLKNSTGQLMRNWWEFYMDFDQALAKSPSLLVDPSLQTYPNQTSKPRLQIQTIEINGQKISDPTKDYNLNLREYLKSNPSKLITIKVTYSDGTIRVIPVKFNYTQPTPPPSPDTVPNNLDLEGGKTSCKIASLPIDETSFNLHYVGAFPKKSQGIVRVFLERVDKQPIPDFDKQLILTGSITNNLFPLEKRSPGRTFYQIAQCQGQADDDKCKNTNEKITLPQGDYNIHCDVANVPAMCSGYRGCTYKGGSTQCDNFRSCQDSNADSTTFPPRIEPSPSSEIDNRPLTCTINLTSLDQNRATISVQGQGGTVRAFIEKQDGSSINELSTTYQYGSYNSTVTYKLTTCDGNKASCTTTENLTLPNGAYNIHCDVIGQNSRCSGASFCTGTCRNDWGRCGQDEQQSFIIDDHQIPNRR